MVRHDMIGHHQALGNFPIAHPLRDEAQHGELNSAQCVRFRVRHSMAQPRADKRVNGQRERVGLAHRPVGDPASIRSCTRERHDHTLGWPAG